MIYVPNPDARPDVPTATHSTNLSWPRLKVSDALKRFEVYGTLKPYREHLMRVRFPFSDRVPSDPICSTSRGLKPQLPRFTRI